MNCNRLHILGIVLLGLMALTLGGCASLPSGPQIGPKVMTWSDDASAYRGQNNQTFTFTLPPVGEESTVWGTGIYTDDSSIGTAAVHAGKITLAAGGTVTIKILPGQSSYTGSTANGVTSLDYDAWEGSFEFTTP